VNVKILIVTQQLIPHEGGLSTHVTDLIAGLRKNGHAVELIQGGQVASSRGDRWIHGALSLGNRDRYRCRRMSALLGGITRLVSEQLRTFQPDLVHCHEAYAGFAVTQAQGTDPRPVVQTVHGPALYEHRQLHPDQPLRRFEDLILEYERTSFAAAKRLIAVDSGQAAILRDDYGVDAGRITVIFNSVNVEDVRRLAAPPPSPMPSQPYFLVPRRLVPKTGVRYAVEALAKMPQKDVHLVIAGDGPLRGELGELAAGLGIGERVQLLGAIPRPRVMPLFAHACGVLVPSVPTTGVVEATSLAVMEAMAAGSVPIASSIGGLAELIDHDETGLLVPPADAAALAAAMSSLVEDSELRRRLVRDGTVKVETKYSTEAWLKRVERVYAAAVGDGSNARPA
jgi:glycosyltransferase involved in cell wall biosynthesis